MPAIKPSLLQTLLREPTRSYTEDPLTYDEIQRKYTNSNGGLRRAGSRSASVGGGSVRSSGSSIRSGGGRYASTSRRTSVYSDDGYDSVDSNLAASLPHAAPPTSQSWEWGIFGGRKNLTGGAASLRAPSEIAKVAKPASAAIWNGVDEHRDDAESIRSFRSARSFTSSLRSNTVTGNGANWTNGSSTGLTNGRSSKGQHGTSRRYSTDPAKSLSSPHADNSIAALPSRRASSSRLKESSPLSRSASASEKRNSTTGTNLRFEHGSATPVAENAFIQHEGRPSGTLRPRPDLIPTPALSYSSEVSSSEETAPPLTPLENYNSQALHLKSPLGEESYDTDGHPRSTSTDTRNSLPDNMHNSKPVAVLSGVQNDAEIGHESESDKEELEEAPKGDAEDSEADAAALAKRRQRHRMSAIMEHGEEEPLSLPSVVTPTPISIEQSAIEHGNLKPEVTTGSISQTDSVQQDESDGGSPNFEADQDGSATSAATKSVIPEKTAKVLDTFAAVGIGGPGLGVFPPAVGAGGLLVAMVGKINSTASNDNALTTSTQVVAPAEFLQPSNESESPPKLDMEDTISVPTHSVNLAPTAMTSTHGNITTVNDPNIGIPLATSTKAHGASDGEIRAAEALPDTGPGEPAPSVNSAIAAGDEEMAPEKGSNSAEKIKEVKTPSNETAPTPIPRIQLIRTESDQKANGVGPRPVEIPEGKEMAVGKVESDSESATSGRKRSKELASPEESSRSSSSLSTHKVPRSAVLTTPAGVATYNVVASSSSTTKRLTTANLAFSNDETSHSSSTAAQDTPNWSKNIRGLGNDASLAASVARSKSTRSSSPIDITDRIRHASMAPSIESTLAMAHAVGRPVNGVILTLPTNPVVVNEMLSSLRAVSPPIGVAGLPTPPPATATSEVSTPVARPPRSVSKCSHRSGQDHDLDAFNKSRRVTRDFSESASGINYLSAMGGLKSQQQQPRRAMSVMSDDASSIGGHSISGRSTMSMPYRPARRSRRRAPPVPAIDGAYQEGREPNGTVKVGQGMHALYVVANTDPSYSTFPFFRRSSSSRAASRSDVPIYLAAERFNPKQDLSFGRLQTPSNKVRSDEVLVEVMATGLDTSDFERTAQMAARGDGHGWVPGRSFSGKVLEAGYGVSKVKRGDLVYGLQGLKKSGAIAERLTVSSEMIAVAPNADLSVEQLSALPMAGVSAVEVMESLCASLPRGSKVLVLNAHEGVGNACMQLSFHFRQAADLYLVAQCPPVHPDVGAYCKATGASEVIVDEPLAAMNGLHESSFDAIVDTVGGRRLYDAGRRILHYRGSFITTVGDSPSLPNLSSQWSHGIRSLRRSFFKKDKKLIVYWAIHYDQRQLVRDSLDKLRIAVEQGGVRPTVRKVFAFKDGAMAFEQDMGSGRVIRVSSV